MLIVLLAEYARSPFPLLLRAASVHWPLQKKYQTKLAEQKEEIEEVASGSTAPSPLATHWTI